MQKNVLGLLVLVALAVLGVAFWYVAGPPPESADARPEAAETAAAVAPEELPQPGPESLPDEPTPAGASEPGSAEPAAVAAQPDERRDAATATLVKGSVRLPAGTPVDERVEILAYVGDDPGFGGFFDLIRDPEALVDRAVIAEDGSFEVGFPDDTTSGWLLLQGRYTYASDSLQVKVPADDPVSFSPELGAWVSGRLLPPSDATDDELEDVGQRIILRPNPTAAMGMSAAFNSGRPPRRTTRAEDELTYEFGGVVAGTSYKLYACPEQLAVAHSDSFSPEPGQHVQLDLTLRRGGTVSGRVVDAQGNPVAEAELEVEQDQLVFGQGGFEVRDGETAEDGTFELIAIAPGESSIQVEANGYLSVSEDIELAEGQTLAGLELVLDTGNSVAGHVYWPDRTPVAGVEVNVRFDPSYLGGMEALNAMRGASGEDQTDEHGRFAVTGLGKGPFVVSAAAEGEDAPGGSVERPGEWRTRVSDVRPAGGELELTLEPPLGVAGRVIDDLGQPIASFRVLARTRSGGGMLAGLGAETEQDEFEDENGEFFLDGLRAGDWELFAAAEGFGRPEPAPVLLPLEEGAVLELVLERAASVRGRVIDPFGQPVAGAEVGLQRTLADFGRRAMDEGEPPSAASDENGLFDLTGLSPGISNLVASAEGFAESEPASVELVAAEVIEDVVVSLRTGGRITGEVFDDDGKPYPGQTVLAQVPTNPTGQEFTTTDGEGRFAFENLAPDTWQVMTFPTGGGSLADGESDGDDFGAFFGAMKLTMAEVRDGEETHVQLGAPPKDPVQIHGRLIAAGEPVPGAMIVFFADGTGGMEAMKFANSDAKGEFEVQLSQPGRYMLNVQNVTGTGQQENVEFAEEIPEAAEHDLVIELPVGGISGRVVGPDGSPVGGVRISLGVDGPLRNGSFTGGNSAEIVTDDDGRYRLQWLRAGTYSVSAGGAFLGGLFGDTGDKTFGRQVRNGLRLSEGERLEQVDFRLKEPGSIRGLTISGGAPVGGAALFVRDAEGNPIDRLSMIQSDSGGRFEYLSLEPGNYTIIARTENEVTSEPLRVRVREGESTEVDVPVDTGCVLLVNISDKEGNPVHCSVEVLDADGNQVNGLWSLADLMAAFSSGAFSSDEQRIGPLSPGRYRVKAVSEDGRTANKPVTVRSQTERKVNLRLD